MEPTDTLIAQRTGTAFYERKISDNNYGTESASIFVQFEITDDESLLGNARDAFATAKASVLEQLGISFSVSESGIVTEAGNLLASVKTVFPGSQVENTPAPVADAASNGGPWYGVRGKDVVLEDGTDAWALLGSNPELFYDNRGQKASGAYKANAPDFKHKASGKGLWQS